MFFFSQLHIRSRRGIIKKAAAPAPLLPLPALPTNPPSSPIRPDFEYAPQTAPPVMTRQFLPFSKDELSPADFSVLADVTVSDASVSNVTSAHNINANNAAPDENHLYPDFSSIIYHALTTPPMTPRLDGAPTYPWGTNAEDFLIDEEMI